MRENGFIGGLRQALISRVDPAAREMVARDLDRLAELGVASFQDALAVARDRERSAETRAIAVWCLGQSQEATPRMGLALADLLETESEELVVWELAKALVTVTDPGEKAELAGRLAASLAAPQPTERRRAIAFALGLLGDARAIAPLARVLGEAGETFRVCETAAEALANLGDPAGAGALIATAEHAFDLQAELVRALAEIGGPETLERLETLAGSLHQEIVQAVSQARKRDRDGEPSDPESI